MCRRAKRMRRCSLSGNVVSARVVAWIVLRDVTTTVVAKKLSCFSAVRFAGWLFSWLAIQVASATRQFKGTIIVSPGIVVVAAFLFTSSEIELRPSVVDKPAVWNHRLARRADHVNESGMPTSVVGRPICIAMPIEESAKCKLHARLTRAVVEPAIFYIILVVITTTHDWWLVSAISIRTLAVVVSHWVEPPLTQKAILLVSN